MELITVTQKEKNVFSIVVGKDEDTTEHEVTLDAEYYEKLTQGKMTPKELIEKSFGFLLERETKESILPHFHLKDIQKYFPEYEGVIREKY